MLIRRRFQRLDVEYFEEGPEHPTFCITYCDKLASPDNIKLILTLQEATELAIAMDAAYTSALKRFPHLRKHGSNLTPRPTVDQTKPGFSASDPYEGLQRK